MLSVFAMSLPVIELSTIVALLTESAPGAAGTFVNCDPSPINPVAVTVPNTYSVVPGVVVPIPTLPVLKTFNIFVVVPTANNVAGVVVPMPTLPPLAAAVNVPLNAMLDAVIEPVAVSVVAVSDPTVALVALSVVMFPVPAFTTDAVIEPVLPATVNKQPAAVNVPVTVAEPVVVSVVTVVEPAFIVPVVFTLIVPDKSAVLIEPSTICALPTELAPTAAGTFVNCDPSPINPVAVTVPITYSVVPGVVVPIPTLPVLKTFNIFVVVPTANNVAGVVVPMPPPPPLAAAVNVPLNAMLDAVIEPVAVSVVTVVEPKLAPLVDVIPAAVIEPVAVSVVAVSDPTVALVALSVVMFPVPAFTTDAVIEPVLPATVNKPPA